MKLSITAFQATTACTMLQSGWASKANLRSGRVSISNAVYLPNRITRIMAYTQSMR